MTDTEILILADEATQKQVAKGLDRKNISYKRAENTNLPAGVEDPEVAVFARNKDMVVLTDDLKNPSFTDITSKDRRPKHINLRDVNGNKFVYVNGKGRISVTKIDPNKYSMDSGAEGHNGVIRYYQAQISSLSDGIDLASEIDAYLHNNSYSKITSNVKTIDLN